MTVKVGSARIDERGNISGGTAGDQTGYELSTQHGYIWSGGWDACIRIKDETKRKKFIEFIKWACASPLIGYDQRQRLTLYNTLKKIGFSNYKKLSTKVECDCSSLVACGLIVAGFPKINPSDTTMSLQQDMTSKYPESFKVFDKNYKNGDHTKKMTWWRNGDILNKRGHHVVTVVSGGKVIAVKKASYYGKYSGKSTKIDEVFKSIGVPSQYIGSVDKRKPIAKANGISDYNGSAEQNLSLISMAKSGKLKRA